MPPPGGHTHRHVPILRGWNCRFPGYETRSSPYRPCSNLSPSARCHLQRAEHFGIVSLSSHWQALSSLSWLSFSPSEFVAASGPLPERRRCQLRECLSPNIHSPRQPMLPEEQVPEPHVRIFTGSTTSASDRVRSPSASPIFFRRPTGHRIELADYSSAIQVQPDYSPKPPLNWTSHSHGNPARPADAETRWLA